MRELSHENLSPDIRASIQGPHHGKLFYLWHPDDVGTARPMPERQWFEVYQPLLVRVARTSAGRDLLGIPANFPVVDRVDHNAIHGRIGGGETLSRFYVGAKFGNRIRYQWPEFRRIAKSIYEHWGPNGLYREPVLNWGGLLVRAAATDTFYPDPDPESTTVDGWARHLNGATWAATQGGSGTGADSSASNIQVFSASRSGGYLIYRGFVLFDTSSLSGEIINAATLGLNNSSAAIYDSDNDAEAYICIVTCAALASATDIQSSDYTKPSTTECHDSGQRMDCTSPPAQNSFQTFSFNSVGRGAISTSGITRLAVREGHDNTNTSIAIAPPTSSDTGYLPKSADVAGTGSDPYLEVTHGLATFVPRTAVII